MAAFAARALLCTLCALALGACRASSPPFWPEENCLNQVSTADYSHGVAYGPQGDVFQYMTTPPFGAASPAVNPYNGRFETFAYAGGSRHAGPMLNDSSTPCRLVARVGEPMAFTVYAEDMDAGDSVRIYVLEDPGIPNGAFVTADEPHQRCMPKCPVKAGDSFLGVDQKCVDLTTGEDLGPCPMCQSSGAVTYGIEHIPASPDGVLALFAKNYTAAGAPCGTPGGCPGASLPVKRRVWCNDAPAQSGRAYGQGKLEPQSEHGRLRKRTLTWTPLPEQGVCLHETRCTYVIKFQAFDTQGLHSSIKVFEVDVIKPRPQYSAGSFGLIVNGQQETFTDPVTSEESSVSSEAYEPRTAIEWMVAERVYKTYINCPMEFAIGLHSNDYDVTLAYTSLTMPPDAKIEWRHWTQECTDEQHTAGKGDVWTDKYGRTCGDYVTHGFCKDGGKGPKFADLQGSFMDLARDGLLPANKACCLCGAGAQPSCASHTSQQACQDNTDTAPPADAATHSAKRPYPPQNGCKWHDSVCRGQAHPYWVTQGVVPGTAAWAVSPSPPVGRKVMGIFKWTPLRGMEGDRHWVCFRGEDREGKHALDEVCSVLEVTKCHYCARVGETLKYVAEQYNFDTNWLRLWNYNYEITDPDMILRSFLPVVIGSTYKVQPGDTLARIAARLRTTVKKILEVNPDMQSPEIEPNQEVCVMPCTEEAYKDAPLNPYNGAAINGVGAGYQEQVPRLSKDPVFDYPLTR